MGSSKTEQNNLTIYKINDIIYVCGSGIAAINTSTDALVSAYNLTRASVTYRLYDLIQNSIDSNIYGCGRMLSGTEIYGYIAKLSSDITSRVFDVQYDISESNKNTYFYGLCEKGDYIYVIARYVDTSSVNYGAVLKISRSDGSVVEKLGISGNTNTFFLPTSIGFVDGKIFIYAYARPYDAARTEAVVLRLDTDAFSELHGKSTSGGDFSFHDITVATSDPLATYGVSGATLLDPDNPTATNVLRSDMDSAGTLVANCLNISDSAIAATLGIEYRPTSEGNQTCSVTLVSDAVEDMTATLTATGVLLPGIEKDYKIKAHETWESISRKFYGSSKYVDVIKANNSGLTLKQKKGIFAPANIWINIPEITKDTVNQGNKKKWYEK